MSTHVIVCGHLDVDPAERERYLNTCRGVVEQGRAAPGCLDFAISPDLLDPGRVNIVERWEDQASVEAFRGDGVGPDDEQATMIRSAWVTEHDVAATRTLS